MLQSSYQICGVMESLCIWNILCVVTWISFVSCTSLIVSCSFSCFANSGLCSKFQVWEKSSGSDSNPSPGWYKFPCPPARISCAGIGCCIMSSCSAFGHSYCSLPLAEQLSYAREFSLADYIPENDLQSARDGSKLFVDCCKLNGIIGINLQSFYWGMS